MDPFHTSAPSSQAREEDHPSLISNLSILPPKDERRYPRRTTAIYEAVTTTTTAAAAAVAEAAAAAVGNHRAVDTTIAAASSNTTAASNHETLVNTATGGIPAVANNNTTATAAAAAAAAASLTKTPPTVSKAATPLSRATNSSNTKKRRSRDSEIMQPGSSPPRDNSTKASKTTSSSSKKRATRKPASKTPSKPTKAKSKHRRKAKAGVHPLRGRPKKAPKRKKTNGPSTDDDSDGSSISSIDESVLSELTSKSKSNQQMMPISINPACAKEPSRSQEAMPTPPTSVPWLHEKHVQEMLHQRRGHFYRYSNTNNSRATTKAAAAAAAAASHCYSIPYVLPFGPLMAIHCGHCNCYFDNGPAARRHILRCCTSSPVTDDTQICQKSHLPMICTRSKDYKALLLEPQFAVVKSHNHQHHSLLALRMHWKNKYVACICGVVDSYEYIHQHTKGCPRVKALFQAKSTLETVDFGPHPTLVQTSVSHAPIQTSLHKNDLRPTANMVSETNPPTYTVFDPTVNNSVKYLFPDGQLQGSRCNFEEKLHRLNRTINIRWQELKDHINDSSIHRNKKWGCTPIQGDRYMVDLSFKQRWNGQETWNQKFCHEFGYSHQDMSDILRYAKLASKRLLTKPVYESGHLATPALILCNSTEMQEFHLDIVGGTNNRQFGMLLSPGDDSTSVLKHLGTSKESVSTMDQAMAWIKIGMEHCDYCRRFSHSLSNSLIEKVKTLDHQDFDSQERLKDGFGELFRGELSKIVQNHRRRSEVSDRFQWQQQKVANCPVGTVFCVDGGVLHAGAGVSHPGGVRSLLFWTWSQNKGEKYDKDLQHTSLTLFVEMASDLWKHLDHDEKMEMIWAIYFLYQNSGAEYTKSIPLLFDNQEQTKNFFINLNDFMASRKERVPFRITKSDAFDEELGELLEDWSFRLFQTA